MYNKDMINILRKGDVLTRTGFSPSHLDTRIKQRLFVPPIPLGNRAVGWVESEINEVLRAMIAGKSKEELKAFVAELVEQRNMSISERSRTETDHGKDGLYYSNRTANQMDY